MARRGREAPRAEGRPRSGRARGTRSACSIGGSARRSLLWRPPRIRSFEGAPSRAAREAVWHPFDKSLFGSLLESKMLLERRSSTRCFRIRCFHAAGGPLSYRWRFGMRGVSWWQGPGATCGFSAFAGSGGATWGGRSPSGENHAERRRRAANGVWDCSPFVSTVHQEELRKQNS